MDWENGTDWREPLYHCALSHANAKDLQGIWRAARAFAYLGDYRDSKMQLQKITELLQERYEAVVTEALATKELTVSVKAVRELEEYGALPVHGADSQAEGKADREEDLRKAQERKAVLYRQKLFHKRIRFGSILFLLCAAVLFSTFFLYRYWKNGSLEGWGKVQQLIEQKDYEAALVQERKLMGGSAAADAEAQIPEIKAKLAYQKTEQQEYEQALVLFDEIGNQEGGMAVYDAWGEDLFAQQEYEQAIRKFEKAGDDTRIQESYLAWGKKLADEGDPAGAIKILERIESDDLRDKVLQGVQKQLYDQVIQRAFYSGDEADPETLREEGKKLDDLNSQLRFCRELWDRGIAAGDVYPEGVEISDVPLAMFQPYMDHQGLRLSSAGKVLIFRRTERKKELSSYGSFALSSSDSLYEEKDQDEHYRVWLLPGEMEALPEEMRAESWEDCSVLLLADTFYHANGYVKVERHFQTTGSSSALPSSITYLYYPIVEAIDNVTIYEKDASDRFLEIDYQRNRPEQYPVYMIGIQDVKIEGLSSESYLQFWGTSDPAFLEDTLQEGVKVLNDQYASSEG